VGKIRKLTLEEWFLDYQLSAIWREYFHLGFHLDIDVTELVSAVDKAGLKFAPTAVMIKAIGLLALERPKINRIMLRTLWGSRILEPDTIGVNIPVMVKNKGDPFLSGMVIKNPDKRSVLEIQGEIREYAAGDLLDKPIGRFVKNRKNRWYNRLALKCLHFMAFRIPKLHLKHEVGAFSASSVIQGDADHLLSRGGAHAHTIMTFGLMGMHKTSEGRQTMIVGISLNHSIMSGGEFQDACNVYSRILSSGEPGLFYSELSDDDR